MRIPLELEHLIKSSLKSHVDNQHKNSTSISSIQNTPKPTSLAGYLSVIDSRKALEVEHYLRACALRLDLTTLSPSTTGFN